MVSHCFLTSIDFVQCLLAIFGTLPNLTDLDFEQKHGVLQGKARFYLFGEGGGGLLYMALHEFRINFECIVRGGCLLNPGIDVTSMLNLFSVVFHICSTPCFVNCRMNSWMVFDENGN